MNLSHLLGVNLGIDTDLLGNLDAVWLQDEPEGVKGESLDEDNGEEPWHKDSLHLAVLLGLQVTVLGGDVLDGVLLLLMANLLCLLELTVGRGTNLPVKKLISTLLSLTLSNLGIFLQDVSGLTFFTVFFCSSH